MTTPVTDVTTVTLVTTQSVKRSPHTPEEWRVVYDELKGDLTFGKFQKKYNIGFSRAAWHKYEHGQMPLSPDMKAELRRVVGLPMTVSEAVSVADPNASVYRVGDGTPHTVVMVGTLAPVELRINGTVTAEEYAPLPRYATQDGLGRAKRERGYTPRPTPSRTQVERFTRLATTWRTVIDAGLAAMEAERCWE